MTELVSCGYSDPTPKYGVKELYHYTVHHHLDKINASGCIKAMRTIMGTALPAVWLTTNPQKEPSIWCRKQKFSPFVPIQFKIKQLVLQYRMVNYISYPEFVEMGGYANFLPKGFLDEDKRLWVSKMHAATDQADADSHGSDFNNNCFLCLRDIRVDNFEEPKVMLHGKWVSIDNLSEAVREAKTEDSYMRLAGLK